jgi:cysteinyl-tRNA synthetase
MQELHIYNTLTRKKEKFEPLEDDFVGMYVCGPTVYGDPHLGHAKSYVSFDVVQRYLRYLDYRVRYVQNITDVGHLTDDGDQGEDKLAKQARKEQLEPMEIAEKYTYKYFRDMDALNVQRPDISPRATGHITEQIDQVRKLIDNGNAYVTEKGNVYFDVQSDEEYGKLSGRKLEEQESGTRIDTASDKKHPADFALWKAADDGHIMKWPSPWGVGYPGWHIECSTMSTKYLGDTFDIHGGGLDNQFPHHECEIAQAECANHQTFARYWMHNNMVTLEGQKMGKSLGNAISLHQFFTGEHDLLTRSWDPQIIRFFLLQSHYRSTTDFSEEALEAAENGLQNLQRILRAIDEAGSGEDEAFDVKAFESDFRSKMTDDFNTAQAIAALFEHLRPLRNQIEHGNVPSNIEDVKKAVRSIADNVLGIWPVAEEQGGTELVDDLIQMLIEMRSEARSNKNFELSDAIRDRLADMGVMLKDGPDGTTYEING